jgi:HEAT repeat protein
VRIAAAVAAGVLLAVGGYFAWSHFAGRHDPLDNQPDTPVTGGPSKVPPRMSDETAIQRRLLKSATWVVLPPESTGIRKMCSGVLIHKQDRLVLTSARVLGRAREATVFFPDYLPTNEPNRNPRFYLDEEKSGRQRPKATVVHHEAGKNLALLQIQDDLPNHLRDRLQAVAFTQKAPGSGSAFFMGASGADFRNEGEDGVLWRFRPGHVLVTRHDKFPLEDNLSIDCALVETSAEINRGDEGGPVVNDHGQLIAIVGVKSKTQTGVALNIDVSEVHSLLAAYFNEQGKHWEPGNADPVEELEGALAKWKEQLGSPEAAQRVEAARKLGARDIDAQDAIPKLLQLLTTDPDPDVRRAVIVALDKIGPPAKVDLHILHDALKSEDVLIRRYAARMLARDGMLDRDGYPTVRVAAQDPDAEVREYAVTALGNFVDRWEQSLNVLITLLRSEADRRVKQRVLEAFGQLGRQLDRLKNRDDDRKFVDLVKPFRDDNDPWVRRMVARVLSANVTADFPDLLPLLLDKLLKDEDAEVRKETLEYLKKYKDRVPKENLNLLLTKLKDRHPETRKYVFTAIYKFVPDADAALPDLIDGLLDEEPEVRESAVVAVTAYGPEAKEAVPKLRMVLKKRDSPTSLRLEVIQALDAIGRQPETIPALLEALADRDETVRARAEDVLVNLRWTREDASSLVKALQNQQSALVRALAAEALGRLGSEALEEVEVVRPLVEATRDRDAKVKLNAVRALGLLGQPAAAAVPELIKMLQILQRERRSTQSSGPAEGVGGERINSDLLKSAVWILVGDQNTRASGSGSLLRAHKHLVLTCDHLLGTGARVRVFFPQYENGDLKTNPSYYLNQEGRLGLAATVLERDALRDLALLQLDHVPQGVRTLPRARFSARTGQPVYSIGQSGALDGVLWRLTQGHVRQVFERGRALPGGQLAKVKYVETDAAINLGDSGAPMVNARGDLVAVVKSIQPGEQLVGYGVDITEVDAFLREASRRHGLNLDSGHSTAPGSSSGSGSELREAVIIALGQIGPEAKDAAAASILAKELTNPDSNLRRSAIEALGAMGPAAKGVIRELLKELLKDEDLEVVVESLAQISTEPAELNLLISLVQKHQPTMQIGVCRVLARMGPKARRAYDVLNRLWKDPRAEPQVRDAANEAKVQVHE